MLSQVVIVYSPGYWDRTTCDAYPDGWTCSRRLAGTHLAQPVVAGEES
jgi:hypothetical protein